MTIKYEPVFGEQSLFGDVGVFTGIDIVTRNVNDGLYRTSRLTDTTNDYLRKNPIVAMRRVIKTPTWTHADKEAGVLPPVGCKYLAGSDNRELECLYNDAAGNVWGFDARGAVSGYALGYCRPIETPEEKAKRLEDEFVTSLCKELDGTSLQHDSIYERGVRAAYRKLKAPTND